MSIENKVILSNLSTEISLFTTNFDISHGVLLSFSKGSPFAEAYWDGITLTSLKRFTALYRVEAFWYKMSFGLKQKSIPDRAVAVWYERNDDLKVILIPLIDKGYSIYFNGKENGLQVMADNNCNRGKESKITGMLMLIDEDPYQLFEKGAKIVQKFISVGTLRRDKDLPEFVDFLGYCSWNTFYHKINQENVVRMVHNIVKKNGCQIGFVLLDDGWQKTRLGRLMDKGVKERKFPDGFKAFVDLLKRRLGTKYFLVWHTFQGYWLGISLKGAYSKRLTLIESIPHWSSSYPSNGAIPNALGRFINKFVKLSRLRAGILSPSEIQKLWDDYHGWLATEGVDGVKVDNQSGTEWFYYDLGRSDLIMKKLHQALEQSVSKHFKKWSIINCMSQNTNVYYQLVESNITRNSQDYFPKNEKSQPVHVLMNAYNDLWCGQFAHPDWDMFQTNHPWGNYQAASRAISGSPIYFADDYLKVNPKVLAKIALPNGKVLRCKDIALPCRENLFLNPARRNRALKLFNRNDYNSILGIFNVLLDNGTTIEYSPSNIVGLDSHLEYAVYGSEAGTITKMKFGDSLKLALKVKGFEVFTVAPIKDGFAPIGLLNKYNPGGIFEKITFSKAEVQIHAKFGGIIGFYCERSPKKVMCENSQVRTEFDNGSKLLKIYLPERENLHFDVFF